MSPHIRYLRIGLPVMAWSGVVLAATYRSHTPAVFGRYSWGYLTALLVLVGGALLFTLGKVTWYQALYRARAGLAISGVSLLLAVGVLELGIRLVDPFGISYYEQIGRYTRDKVADDHLVFRHKPLSQARYGHVLVTYNEQGLRDRPIAKKATGEYRILALGDSVTFGWGVDQDKTFAARLESFLPSRLHRPVRVINSGVGGYNTVQEVVYFMREGLTLQPDLVILTYVENDIEALSPTHLSGLVATSNQGMSPLGTVQALVGKLWPYRLANHTYNYGSQRASPQRSMTAARESVGWRQSMAALHELVTICNERRIPLMVFFERTRKTEETTTLLQDVARNAPGIPVVDMAPWYAGVDAQQFMNSKIDRHPNAEGHRLMAEHMAIDIVRSMNMASPTTILAGQR